MRKPVLVILIAVIVGLLVATGMYYQKYQKSTASYTETQTRYSDAINEIASIQDSLNAIVLGDSAVQLLPSDLETERRLSETQGDEALARIEVLKAGIERTKEKIDQLEASLKASGVKVAGLQRMIANFKKSVAEKEQQVALLTGQVDSLQTTVTGLVAEVEQSQESIQAQAQEIEDKRRELASIYYMIGTKKDLTTSGVVVAKGGLLGMGKTLEASGTFNENLFTALDTDQETVIRIPAAKAQVLSDQPPTSYQMVLVGEQLELRITDPQAFRTVKHLVIMTT